MQKTKEVKIKTVMSGVNHVLILGACASIASTYWNRELYAKNQIQWTILMRLLDLEL